MTRRKVVLIGAGSTVFTQRLVADLILEGEEGAWEVALVDIDATTLDAVERLVRKMLASRPADIPLTATTDRREALPGADVVVTTIAVGGRPGWQADIEVPRKHGIFQPVGDSVLPGGISRAMRMIPPMLEIARDVERLCPDAHLLNYSNPMTAICRAIRRETPVPVVGLCHGVAHVENQIARFLGHAPGSVTSLGHGLNHLTFLTRLWADGEDAGPLIRQRLAEQRPTLEAEIAQKAEWPNIVPEGATPRYSDDPFSWGLYEAHGAFPCAMDRHAVEFFPELFPGGAFHGRTLGREAFPIDKRIALGDQWYADMLALARSPDPLPQDRWDNLPGESEQLLQIMRALFGGPRGIFSVNVPNRGQAPWLPRDAVIECDAAAVPGAFVPLMADPLPDALVEKLRRKCEAVELTVDAAVRGDKEAMLEAMLADGGVTDRAAARALRDDLLAAHAPHLPQFA